MDKITVDDLYNWMHEKEEDPIVDGPILLPHQQTVEFVNSLDKNIIDEEEFDFLGIGGGQFSEKQESYLVQKFVDFLNQKGYVNLYRYQIKKLF